MLMSESFVGFVGTPPYYVLEITFLYSSKTW